MAITSQQPQIFISYQRSDEAFARQVREHLALHGVRTWMDQYDIPVGTYWPDEIDKGLSGSDIVVGVLSPASVESRNVKNEWDWAILNGKRLLLVQVAPCLVPHRYVSLNFIDATVDAEAALAGLLSALGITTPAVAPDRSEQQMPIPTRHSVRRGPARARTKPLLVGREREQALLARELDNAIAGTGRLVLMGGEAGIGKTTLTRWLLAEAEERGAIALTGGCYDLTTTPPYGPWLEVLRAWAGEQRQPELPAVLQPEGSFAGIGSQSALFELIADTVAEGSAVSPLVVLLEDLHWTDPASLDLLRVLARRVTDWHVLLVVTYRDDELTRRHPLAQALPALVREAQAERVTLGRLAELNIGTLIDARFPMDAAQHDQLTTYVTRVSEGNPFFAGEVLRSLEEIEALTRRDDRWHVGELDRAQVPELVRQVIEGRLERLGDEARRALEIAAVIGHEVPLDLWTAVSGLDEGVLAETLERASEARLIEELPRASSFRFAHALIRETLYDGIVSLRRRSWHRTAGEILAAVPRPDPDAVAHHFQAADDARAGVWLRRAGSRASQGYDWGAAIERFESALRWTDSDRTRGWLLWQIAFHLELTDAARSEPYAAEALQLARAAGDAVLEALALCELGFIQLLNGRATQGITHVEAGVALFDRVPKPSVPGAGFEYGWFPDLDGLGHPSDDRPLTSINPQRGMFAGYLTMPGHVDRALAIGEAGIREADALPQMTRADEQTISNAWWALGAAYAWKGRPGDATTAYESARSPYLGSGAYKQVTIITGQQLTYVTLVYRTADMAERNRLRSIVEVAMQRGGEVMAQGSPLTLWFIEGRWSELRALADRLAGTAFVPVPQETMLLDLHQGKANDAWTIVEQWFPSGPTTEPGELAFPQALRCFWAAVRLSVDADDLDGARRWTDTYARWLDWSGAVLWSSELELLRARCARLANDLPLARTHMNAALALAADPAQPLVQLEAYRLLGELCTATGDLVEAATHLDVSLALADACHAPFERAHSLLALAELRFAQDRPQDAHGLLAEVRAICEPLEARPTLARVAALEERLPAGNVP